MHRYFLTLVAAFVAVGCDSAPSAPEHAAVPLLAARDGQPAHDNHKAPFSRTVMNPCPPVPEPVVIEGVLHYNAHFKFFDGGNRNRLMSNSHGSGVGAITHVKYQFHEINTIYGTFTYVNGRLEADHHTRFHLISQTDLGNFFVNMRAKQVCTAQGCTFVVVAAESDCRG